MSDYSVVDAKNKLSELIDRARKGEKVVITRHGQPVVEMKPVKKKPHVLTQADLDWLDANRVPVRLSPNENAGELVSRMRDEDWR